MPLLSNPSRLLFALALLAAAATTAAADTPWRLVDRSESPRFESDDGTTAPLMLESTRYDVTVSGVVAQVRVTQTYVNRGAAPLDARYVFPMSTRAAVFGMTMRIGQRRIVASIEEKVAAQRIYEAARASGQVASLVQQHRPNVFETRVANIAPADRVVVELDYVELITPTEAVYELVVPAVIGPRYVGGATRDADWAQAALGEMGQATWAVDITIDAGVPVRAVTSTSHRMRVSDDADGTTRVGFAEPPDRTRDLVVRYALTGDAVQAGVLRFRGEKEKYFLALVEPPARVAPASVLPRELIFVVDVSGSMTGFPIETSKRLMAELIAELHPWERFNILTFAGGQAVLAPESLVATPASKQRAAAFMQTFGAGGGTELLPAMRQAYALPEAHETVRSLVLLTDGFVTVEPEAFDLVRSNLGRANVFAFGIGTSVNRHLIEGLARVGRSAPFVIQSAEYAQDAAIAFRTHLDAPVLTDLSASFTGVEAYDVEPPLTSLPDVFADRPVIFFGKYRGDGGTLTLSGRTAAGRWSQTVKLDAAGESPRRGALAILWARERIARLADLGAPSEATRAEVLALGLAHHLVTPFTSFVAVHRTLAADGGVTQEERTALVPAAALPAGPDPATGGGSGDTDGDGILDVNDACPMSPDNSCRALIALASTKIEIAEVVFFAKGSAKLSRKRTRPTLDVVAELLRRNPWITQIAIEGHTDTTEARDKAAERLSRARAQAVLDYLVRRGVAPERLVVHALGATMPADTNKTPDGRAKNRRVAFTILVHTSKR